MARNGGNSLKPTRKEVLSRRVQMFDITSKAFDTRGIIEAYEHGGCAAWDLARATRAYERMLADPNCTVMLTLAGTSSGFGAMEIWPTLIKHRMVDAVVATGASLIDMDLYHALEGNHYQGNEKWDNAHLREMHIDRLYNCTIDEDVLQKVDAFAEEVCESLEPKPHAPHEILWEIGKRLDEGGAKRPDTLLQEAYRQGVPVFCPALTDSAFGMGATYHEVGRALDGKPFMTLNTTRDNTNLTKLKMKAGETGLFMVAGGVPSNFVQDVIIVGEGLTDRFGRRLGITAPETHKYAIKVTVADARDGGLSGSTVEEAVSWGKITAKASDADNRVMVFAENTLAVPLIAGAAYHGRAWEGRAQRRYADWLAELDGPGDFGDIVRSKPKAKKVAPRTR